MTSVAVIGAQWGDEGKGSVIARLGPQADMVVRYNGGGNSGHKSGIEGVYFNIVPSGLLYPHIQNVIGPGVVYSPPELISEVGRHISRGLNTDNLHLSEDTSVTMPYHLVLELLEELDAPPEFQIGTTRKAIGPTIQDFHGRRHDIRTRDLLNKDELAMKLRYIVPRKNAQIKMYQELVEQARNGKPLNGDEQMEKALETKPFDADQMTEEYYGYGRRLQEFMRIVDTVPIVYDTLRRDDNVIFEGAQGTMLDVRFGVSPYVTSSPTISAAVGLTGGVGMKVDHVLGVVKTYSTRVGNGPMETEMHNETERRIREVADEKGTTTGRQRRIGWLHAPLLGRSQQLNRFDGIAIVGLNVLAGLPELKIYTGDSEMSYDSMDTWPELDIESIKRGGYAALPKKAQDYVMAMTTFMDDVPVDMIALGFHPDETLVLRDVFAKK